MLYKEGSEKVPCKMACPVGMDIPRYIRFVSQGKFDEALAVIRHKIPFPLVCGYVCPKPCETACIVGKLGEPVRIKELKRFAAQHGQNKRPTPISPCTDKRVAIVGSGPAGLTAAYYLAKKGHNVAIFEKECRLGGMLWFGIPSFILPKDILEREINDILGFEGIELKLNKSVDAVTDLLEDNYDAVFIASGACEARKLPIPGNDLEGVLPGLSFLRQVNLGEDVEIGKRVLVLGGGSVAFDVARSALRLGAKVVEIYYRRSRKEMTAISEEVEEAIREGVKVHFLVSPIRIIRRGKRAVGLECLRMKLGEPDKTGRRKPIPVKGSNFKVQSDTIVAAIGQEVNRRVLKALDTNQDGTVRVNPKTGETSMKGVFAGGDVVTGPGWAIDAIAAGRRAAVSIDKFLGGDGNIEEIQKDEEEIPMRGGVISIDERLEMPVLPLKKRLSGFDEIYTGLAEKQAINEANRCLWCDLPIFADITKCVGCNTCAMWCSFASNNAFNPTNAKIRILPPDRGPEFAKSEIGFTDDCDSCGICVSRCFYGALLRGKPKGSWERTND